MTEFITAGTGQPGNRNSNICAQQFPDTGGHCSGRLGRYRTIVFQDLPTDTQQLFLHFIHIADNAAFEHIGRTGNRRQSSSNTAPGQAFGCCQFHSTGPKGF